MAKGKCQHCDQIVEIDVPPDGHTRSEHHPNCDGYTCSPNCPIPVLCGPVNLISKEEQEARYRAAMYEAMGPE